MAEFFRSKNLSKAWYDAASFLLGNDFRGTHLVLAVAQPLDEIPGVRHQVDRLFGRQVGVSSEIERVADTIFPQDFYVPGESQAMKNLFERQRTAREFEKETVPKGNYFDHCCNYPYGSTDFNQLEHVVNRLRESRKQGQSNGNKCEIAVSEVPSLRIQTPGVHKSIMGFPCLSHISITLAHSKVHLAATYRAQDFSNKGYGNLLGLGRLAHFFATESDFKLGEVLCIATGAILATPPAGLTTLRDVITKVGDLVGGNS